MRLDLVSATPVEYVVHGPWLAVVAVWAAAAGAAGAYLPRHIAGVIWDAAAVDGDVPLDQVVREAMGRAIAQNRDEDGTQIGDCEPRGCEVEYAVEGGECVARSIIWRTSVEVRLYRPSRDEHGELVGQARIPNHPTRLREARLTAEAQGLIVQEAAMW